MANVSKMPIHIAVEGERLEPGNAYIGEPADHLTLAARSFGELGADPHRMYRNRTVDLLFHSVAAHGQACTIGVILSGSLPAEQGMPENAISYDGPIDLIAGAREIASAIQYAVRDENCSDTFVRGAETPRLRR